MAENISRGNIKLVKRRSKSESDCVSNTNRYLKFRYCNLSVECLNREIHSHVIKFGSRHEEET